ncbi:MAG TPA: hypothetical protein VHL54_10670, partial [Actinomycetota bacterium]|nr:hypothetical protein [Actinomycetota bacterium]
IDSEEGRMNSTLTDQVKQKYAWTAREVIQEEFSQLTVLGACCGGSDGGACCSSAGSGHVHDSTAEPVEAFGASLYPASQTAALPSLAVSASCGCGNPTAIASLQPGQVVVDLGSGAIAVGLPQPQLADTARLGSPPVSEAG